MKLQYKPKKANIRQPNQWGVWDNNRNDWWHGGEWFMTNGEAFDRAVGLTQAPVTEVDTDNEYPDINMMPAPLDIIDWNPVLEAAKGYIESLAAGSGYDSDKTHYIVEDVMQAVYGKRIYDWINDKV